MNRQTSRLWFALVTMVLFGCHTHPVDDGTLASMKRNQESRLMYECINEYGTISHGGLSLDLIQACQKEADARVW